MEKKSSKKLLLVGIVGALAVLAAVLALVLTQCTGGGTAQTEPTQSDAVQTEGYELYWNLDRKEYDGKSEAGMSSRKADSDGYFHVRFFKDGQTLELKVADRKLINTIDTYDLMGLTFDEDGTVVGVTRVDRMPLERVGWQFYVQSTGGYCFNEGGNIYCGGTFNMQGGYIGGGTVYTYGTGSLKENCSSQNFFLVNGTLNHYGGTIYGGVHAIDNSATRVCTVVLAGSPVIDGGKDCEKNLTLNTSGDGVKLIVTQLTDYARIGVSSVGIFSEKTGTIKAVGRNVQVEGQCVWIRAAGQTLNLYDVTLDASGATNTRRGGALYGNAGTAVNMYAGRIAGGTAQAWYKEETKTVVNGMGGNVYTDGSFTMYGGAISGGSRIGGGSEVKRNIFAVNGKVNVSGGQLCGGVNIHGGSGRLNISKDAVIRTDEEGKSSLSLSGGALLTVDGTLNNADILLSDAADTKLAASGSHDYKNYFTSDKNLLVTVEEDGMYLRAANAHVHCLCGRTDGTHAEGCGGGDVVFAAWEKTDSLPGNGTYYLTAENGVTLNNQHWVGTQNDPTTVNLTLCLNNKTVQSASTSTERVIMVWTGSTMTLTDCGTAGSVTISGAPKIVSSEEGKASLSTSYVLTIAKPGLDKEARIKITSAPAGALAVAESDLKLTDEMAACFTNDSGVAAILENSQILFK